MSIDAWICVTAGPLTRSAHGKFPANTDHIYKNGEKTQETRAEIEYSASAFHAESLSRTISV